jgi:cellulose synthase/poly-beta-1,6-N-acetylglucosamine synthase-like glycosyltransferase
VPPPSHRTPPRPAPEASREHALLDELDVAVLVGRRPPWQLAALQAALAADLGARWTGGALLVEDRATRAGAGAAREALRLHHPLARRTVLTLTRRTGAAAAANLVLAEATGEYVALLDGGTRPGPGALSLLVRRLHDDHGALWAAPAAPGLAVVRRVAFLTLGGFDPGRRGADAVADAVRRARHEGWRLLVAAEAPAHRDAGVLGPPRRGRGRFATATPTRAWSGAALEAWLPRARLAASRVDLP